MNERVKNLWCKVLPEYQQTYHCLNDGNGFCCLGVLTDLYLKETGQEWVFDPINEEYSYNEGSYVLPEVVKVWAGLKTNNPCVAISGLPNLKALSTLNDDAKFSFKQIAKCIEDNWKDM